jgi:formyltetrahydrofolate-dependent phosphoribosylglycinamide formyltransferase
MIFLTFAALICNTIPVMFENLQKKWKVGGLQLALIISTFAIGGSLTGYAGKKIMNLLSVQQDWLWTVIYILLIIIIWPLAVIIISIPFGQFSFFIRYIRKIGGRMGLVRDSESGVRSSESGVGSNEKPSQLTTHHSPLTNIVIFASGTGSNAQKIIDRLNPNPSPQVEKGDSKTPSIRVALIVCNNPEAGVLQIAQKENIPAIIIEKEKFFSGDAYIKELQEKNINWIILAGFLWKIPDTLIKAYRNKIINIHPALLPKYGGKGMYGHAVHEAVIAAKEKESGITIHYVDELYDHGRIIFQAKCPVLSNDTAGSLAQRIHTLEHEYYSKVIEQLVLK